MKKKIICQPEETACLLQVAGLIEKEMSCHHSLKALSQRFGLNRHKLTYGFREMFGTSIYTYLVDCRMRTAQLMLTETNLPVKEIAGLCGYSSSQSFNNTFRRYYHLTPMAMRHAAK